MESRKNKSSVSHNSTQQCKPNPTHRGLYQQVHTTLENISKPKSILAYTCIWPSKWAGLPPGQGLVLNIRARNDKVKMSLKSNMVPIIAPINILSVEIIFKHQLVINVVENALVKDWSSVEWENLSGRRNGFPWLEKLYLGACPQLIFSSQGASEPYLAKFSYIWLKFIIFCYTGPYLVIFGYGCLY